MLITICIYIYMKPPSSQETSWSGCHDIKKSMTESQRLSLNLWHHQWNISSFLAGWQGIWGGFQRILKFFAGWWHDIPIIIMCTIVNLLCMSPWEITIATRGAWFYISIKWCVFTPIALLEERMKVWWAAHDHSLLFIYGQLVLESIRVVQNHFDKSKPHVASASKNKQPKGLV